MEDFLGWGTGGRGEAGWLTSHPAAKFIISSGVLNLVDKEKIK